MIEDCDRCPLGRASAPAACPFQESRCPAGAVLLRQGETPREVWYLKSGAVLLSSTTEVGAETSCALRGAGALIGHRVDHEAWALSDVVACRIAADAFRDWVGLRGTPGAVVLECLIREGIDRQRERVAVSGRAVSRVARFLLQRSRVVGPRPLRVEQQVMARVLGIRHETLCRVLARLRQAGALAEGRSLGVRDPSLLERLAEDDLD